MDAIWSKWSFGSTTNTSIYKTGFPPILGGRRTSSLFKLALDFGLDCRIFNPSNHLQTRESLKDMQAVVNCSGQVKLAALVSTLMFTT